jgi:hypothetical protein
MIKKNAIAYFPFLIGLLSGLYFISLGAVGKNLYYFPGDLADARFNNYLLEHAYQFFIGNVESYWNAPFMYPEEKVISYSDNLLGSAPFYAVFRLLRFDRATAFQLWFLLMTVFNYTACYFFLRFLFKNNLTAVCGAMIFAFSIALYTQIGHAQTFPRFMIPLSIWMGVLYLRELRVKYFFLMLLFLVYQIYCGIYLGFMLAVPIGLFLILSIFFRRGLYKIKIKNKRWNIWMLVSIFTNALILLFLMLPYLERAKQTGFYSWENILQSIPTPVSYVFSHHGSMMWDFMTGIAVEYPAFWDHKIFPGAIALMSFIFCVFLAIVKLIKRNFMISFQYDLQIKILFICGLTTFLIFLRIGDFSLYRIIHHIPGFGSMRALQRIINIELLFMAAAVAYCLQHLIKKRNLFTYATFIIVVGLIILDNRIHPDTVHKEIKEISENRINAVILKIETRNKNTILSYEPDSLQTKQIYYQLDAMLAAQSLGMKTLNGYSATSPNGYAAYWILPNEESRKVWLLTKNITEKNILVVN